MDFKLLRSFAVEGSDAGDHEPRLFGPDTWNKFPCWTVRLYDFAHVIERETGAPGEDARRVAIPHIAEEVRFDPGAGVERLIDHGVIEPGHGPAI